MRLDATPEFVSELGFRHEWIQARRPGEPVRIVPDGISDFVVGCTLIFDDRPWNEHGPVDPVRIHYSEGILDPPHSPAVPSHAQVGMRVIDVESVSHPIINRMRVATANPIAR